MSIEQELTDWLRAGLAAAAPRIGIEPEDLPAPQLLAPKRKDQGDFATNVAMAIAPSAGKPPGEIAQALADALAPAPFVERVEIAGPGFLNLFTRDDWLHATVRSGSPRPGQPATDAGTQRGERRPGRVRELANPTGPSTIGHARNAAIGDALAYPLASGPVGRTRVLLQRRRRADGPFGRSVEARVPPALGPRGGVARRRLSGRIRRRISRAISLPSKAWAIAALAGATCGLERLRDRAPSGSSRDQGHPRALRGQPSTSTVPNATSPGRDRRAIRRLREAGAIYEAEGAVWFRSTAFGDDKDRVVIRSNGTAHLLRRRLRLPHRQVPDAASTTSSTSGAPTTTATSPG